MYKHVITIELSDELVHRYSIMEWEQHFLRYGVTQRDELPLSYGRIAEILAEEYHKYGAEYFINTHGSTLELHVLPKETTSTSYHDANGLSISTRVPRADPGIIQVQ